MNIPYENCTLGEFIDASIIDSLTVTKKTVDLFEWIFRNSPDNMNSLFLVDQVNAFYTKTEYYNEKLEKYEPDSFRMIAALKNLLKEQGKVSIV